MSGLLGWIKGHLLIVACMAIILVILPVGFVFSNSWNARIKTAATSAYQDQQRKIAGRSTVPYTLPRVLEDEEPFQVSRAPNRVVTEYLAEQSRIRNEQVDEVMASAQARNRRDHTVLMAGVFPNPPTDRRGKRLLNQFASMLTGNAESASVFESLIVRYGGGEPVNANDLAIALDGFETEQREELSASNADNRMTRPQQDELREELVRQRIGAYVSRASSPDLSFFCTPDAFFAASDEGFSVVPARLPAKIDARDVFEWQWNYWVIEDILAAVDRANTGPGGIRTLIPDSVVKSVEQIRISVLPEPKAEGDDDDSDDSSRYIPQTKQTGRANRATHTGRKTDDNNGVYDIRTVTLTVVVSSAQLPKLFDALDATNFMTVTGLTMRAMDPWAELKRGMYYGKEPVARAEIQIETAWLRDWTTAVMPEPVKLALGVDLPEPEVDEDDEIDNDG